MTNELFLPLKAKWFDKIKSGEKTTEYREVKPYWQKRFMKKYDAVRFARGYSGEQMTFKIDDVDIINGKQTDLAIDAPVYAIKLGRRTK